MKTTILEDIDNLSTELLNTKMDVKENGKLNRKLKSISQRLKQFKKDISEETTDLLTQI